MTNPWLSQSLRANREAETLLRADEVHMLQPNTPWKRIKHFTLNSISLFCATSKRHLSNTFLLSLSMFGILGTCLLAQNAETAKKKELEEYFSRRGKRSIKEAIQSFSTANRTSPSKTDQFLVDCCQSSSFIEMRDLACATNVPPEISRLACESLGKVKDERAIYALVAIVLDSTTAISMRMKSQEQLEPVSKPVCRAFKRVAAGWSFSTTV
jgi:hypothetical protein